MYTWNIKKEIKLNYLIDEFINGIQAKPKLIVGWNYKSELNLTEFFQLAETETGSRIRIHYSEKC